jgi:hypothetical protein
VQPEVAQPQPAQHDAVSAQAAPEAVQPEPVRNEAPQLEASHTDSAQPQASHTDSAQREGGQQEQPEPVTVDAGPVSPGVVEPAPDAPRRRRRRASAPSGPPPGAAPAVLTAAEPTVDAGDAETATDAEPAPS